MEARKPPKSVQITRRTGCNTSTKIATVKVNQKTGKGTVVLPKPVAADVVAVYRIVAKSGGGASYALPIAVRP